MTAAMLYVTWPEIEGARACAGRLLEARLAACVNLIPGMESHYRWEGRVERGREVMMLVKTSATRVVAARNEIAALHPYETPCIIHLVVGAEASAAGYLDWIARETGETVS